MKAIILAAGFGTRLYPITKEIPKALLPLHGKVMLDYLFENLAKTKPKSVAIVTNNFFYEQFIVWKSKQRFSFPIHIINNGVNRNEERKGAVLDLYHGVCHKEAGKDVSLVLSSDNYFDYPLSHFIFQGLHHLPGPAIGVYDVNSRDDARKFGVVQMDEHHVVKSFIEKPENPASTQVSVGAYLFPDDAYLLLYEYLRKDPSRTDRVGDFIAWLSKQRPTLVIPFEGVWKDIGDLESYADLLSLLTKRKKVGAISQ